MRSLRRATLVAALVAVSALGACTEELSTLSGCPVLCPGQDVSILDTVLDPAITFDTTLAPFPIIGSESVLLLADRGDTLDVRAIVRFDTLPRRYSPTGDTLTPITRLDSATLAVQLKRTALAPPETFVLEAYDVTDTVAVDSVPSALLPYFVPSRLLGAIQVDSGFVRDSVSLQVPIDPGKLLLIVTDTLRVLRIGLRVRGSGSTEVTLTGVEGGTTAPTLRFRASADTAVKPLLARPYSRTPLTPLGLNEDFRDYSLVVSAPGVRAAERLSIGGIPGHRAYLRFDLPVWLTDSVAVLSARLELMQEPIRGMDAGRSFVVRAHLGFGAWDLFDLARAARLLAPAGLFITDSLVLSPADSGWRSFEMYEAVRQWRTVNGRRAIPSTVILRPDVEGAAPTAARFFGRGAPQGLRPRLRISYVPSIRFGQP